MKLIVATTIILAVVLLVYCENNKKCVRPRTKSLENYGGPIRNVKKIPITDCYKMCGQNDSRCRQMYPSDNVGKCSCQWESCVAECYFSNAQRM